MATLKAPVFTVSAYNCIQFSYFIPNANSRIEVVLKEMLFKRTSKILLIYDDKYPDWRKKSINIEIHGVYQVKTKTVTNNNIKSLFLSS